MAYIYKITNKINNKIYIGQTIKERPSDRFSQHRYSARHPEQDNSNSYLHKAMREYGVDNFIFEIIEEVPVEVLDERECFWISELNSLVPNGYNLTDGGEGTKGYSRPQSIEERLKRQQSNKKFYEDNPEAIEQARERTKEFWQNEEYRQKVTEGVHKFYNEHPDLFSGKNNPFYGKTHTEESRAKIKEAAKLKKKPIAQLDKETLEIIKIYDGVKDAEKELEVSHGWIAKAANLNKVAYGYRWKFV